MRSLLALVFLPTIAFGTTFEFDMSGPLEPTSTLPLNNTAEVSFWINTGSVISTAYSFLTDPVTGTQCLNGFNFSGVSASHIDVSVGGKSIWDGGSGAFAWNGDNPNGHCPSGFFSGFSLTDANHSLTGSIDLLSQLTKQQFLTSDPMATLVNSFRILADDGSSYRDNTGVQFNIDQRTQIHSVPEPSPLPLFLTGLVLSLAAIARRKAGGRPWAIGMARWIPVRMAPPVRSSSLR